MKILYIGTVTNNEWFEEMVSNSSSQPSAAPQTFENTLLRGIKNNGFENIECLTFPMIAAYPKSRFLYWGKEKQVLDCGVQTTFIPAINLKGIKMFSQLISSRNLIKKWLEENRNEAEVCVLMYSIYGPIAKNVVNLCRKYNRKCVAFVPDLPEHMYMAKKGIGKFVSRFYVASVKKIQGKFSGYIYLTEAMRERISNTKPYIVVEGLADEEIFAPQPKYGKKSSVVMYAGAVSKTFGVDRLTEGFRKSNIDAQLHIYGSGEYVGELKAICLKDERIKYMGRVSHSEILQKEREAELLLNLRNPSDDFTKYSFPSKTMEYMASGTPVLTTRLEGIPEEYFKYCYSVNDNNVDTVKNELERIFSLSPTERKELGERAKSFIKDNKTGEIQAGRILNFLESLF